MTHEMILSVLRALLLEKVQDENTQLKGTTANLQYKAIVAKTQQSSCANVAQHFNTNMRKGKTLAQLLFFVFTTISLRL